MQNLFYCYGNEMSFQWCLLHAILLGNFKYEEMFISITITSIRLYSAFNIMPLFVRHIFYSKSVMKNTLQLHNKEHEHLTANFISITSKCAYFRRIR